MLAAKAALAIRYDALGEDTNAEMGAENRAKLEARLRQLEERGVSKIIETCIICLNFVKDPQGMVHHLFTLVGLQLISL